MRQRQMREDALVDLVLQAREQLQILGVPFSGKALATHIRNLLLNVVSLPQST